MTNDDKMLHLIERFNRINSGKEEIDQDSKSMLTIAFLRTWLEKSGKDVNEGILLTLFNGVGNSFFKKGMNFKITDKSIEVLNEKQNKGYDYSFNKNLSQDGVLGCRVRTKKSNGYFEVCDNTMTFVDRLKESTIVSEFDFDGIEKKKTVISDVSDKGGYLFNSGYKQQISLTREELFLEKTTSIVPYGIMSSVMQDYLKKEKDSYSSFDLVSFVTLPSLNFGSSSDFAFSTNTFFDNSMLNLYEGEFKYVQDLQLSLAEKEVNSMFRHYFPRLSEVAEKRIMEIIEKQKGKESSVDEVIFRLNNFNNDVLIKSRVHN